MPCSGVSLAFRCRRRHRDHRPLGLRQVDDGALHQPHARGDPGRPREGEVLLDGLDLYDADVDVVAVRRAVGMVFQKPNPFPTMSIFENVAAGPAADRRGARRADRTRRRARHSRAPALWDEVKDRLDEHRASASPAASSSGSASRARIAVEPEVLLMDEPCSALDPVATLKIEELIGELKQRLHDRDRHPQHAAGGARRRHDRFFMLERASWSRSAPTDKIFTNPDDERTEEYVTGKFG